MYIELKKAILNWLIDNESEFQRVNTCARVFRQYIYDSEGEYIIGGKIVHDFICNANKLIYN